MFGQDAFSGDFLGQVSNRSSGRTDGRRSRDNRVTVIVRDGAEVVVIVRDERRNRSRGRSGGRF